jgi:hypothetical protein
MERGLLGDFQPQGVDYGNSLLEEPVPYDLSGFKAVSDVAQDYANQAYQSFLLPSRVVSGEFGIPSVNNPAFVGAGQQFAMDFGMLPALATAAVASPAANTLRMGMGGSDTVSGGARRLPETDELGFYSQALETARMLPQAKGTGEQFRKMLDKAGVKPDEITFTPELEGLLSQPKVTREEIVGLLQENRIRPQETVLRSAEGGGDELLFGEPYALEPDYDVIAFERDDILYDLDSYGDEVAERMVVDGMDEDEAQRVLNIYRTEGRDSEKLYPIDKQYVEEAAEGLARARYTEDEYARQIEYPSNIGYTIREDYDGYQVFDSNNNMIDRDIGSLEEAQVVATSHASGRGLLGGEGDTKFFKFKERGGDNYREMLLQVPEYQGKSEDFVYQSHFSEPNIAVHARTTDRNFGVGEKGLGDSLYVEELQSDWSQRGRDFGFKTQEDSDRLEGLKKAFESARDERIKVQDERKALTQKALNDFAESKGLEVRTTEDGRVQLFDGDNLAMGDIDLRNFMFRGEPALISRYTPDGKFINNETASPLDDWPDYYAKAMDKQRAAKAKAVSAEREYDEVYRKLPKAPFVKNTEKFTEAGIKRLINQAVKEDKKSIVFSSGDIQSNRWSNEGLETFYDKIIPKVAEKVVKRLDPDAKPSMRFVEDATGDVSGDRFVIEITPKMREEALRGQPLFTVPAVPTGLLGEEKMSGDEMLRAGII